MTLTPDRHILTGMIRALTAILALLSGVAGCSGGGAATPDAAPPVAGPAAIGLGAGAGVLIYALSPENSRIAEYPLDSSGPTQPVRLIVGTQTQLDGTVGLAVDRDGRIYVLKSSPAELLVFHRGATGNASPERIVQLGGAPSGLTTGPALDGKGGVWVAVGANHELLRYSSSASGVAKPLIRVRVRVTASGHVEILNPVSVAVGPNGVLYTTWGVLINGEDVAGISEYQLRDRGKTRLLRWFGTSGRSQAGYVISVDDRGAMYLTAPFRGAGVAEFYPRSKSGVEREPNRIFAVKPIYSYVQATTESAILSYVATGKGIAVFGPKPRLFEHALRTIKDPANLDYNGTFYSGPLLSIH
jgi:hypothetical protein